MQLFLGLYTAPTIESLIDLPNHPRIQVLAVNGLQGFVLGLIVGDEPFQRLFPTSVVLQGLRILYSGGRQRIFHQHTNQIRLGRCDKTTSYALKLADAGPAFGSRAFTIEIFKLLSDMVRQIATRDLIDRPLPQAGRGGFAKVQHQ
ncbi:hypothetical protein CXB49_07465 [Chromobacterium sp. ATCC 53434]|nr:hypothetical protein CXB49_07465 [Chromobacterium sp. ATCC 53434]